MASPTIIPRHLDAPFLPPEVINLIITRANTRDLKNFSLISSGWRGPCQEALFSIVWVDPKVHNGLYDALVEVPGIGDHIKILVFCLVKGSLPRIGEEVGEEVEEICMGTKRLGPHSVAVIPQQGSGQVHPRFPAFLRSLNRLTSLRIHKAGIQWSALPLEAIEAFLDVFSRPTFTELQLDPFFSELPFALLPFCFHLENLFIFSYNQRGYDECASVPVWPEALDKSRFNLANNPPVNIKSLTLYGINTIYAFTALIAKNDTQLSNPTLLSPACQVSLGYDFEICTLQLPNTETNDCLITIGDFLQTFGTSFEVLFLEFETDSEDDRTFENDVQNLIKLRLLNLSYRCTLVNPDSVCRATTWINCFLEMLPAPDLLETLQLQYDVFDSYLEDEMELFEDMDILFDELEIGLKDRFPNLTKFYINMLLPALPEDEDEGAPPEEEQTISDQLCSYRSSVEKRLGVLLKGLDVEVCFEYFDPPRPM